MKKIQITKNMVTLVDDADYAWLNQWKWIASKMGNSYYVVRRVGKKENSIFSGSIISMHRLIAGCDGLSVDHIDGNSLNNQRANLRSCTHSENMKNRKKPNMNTEKYKGIKEYKGVKKSTWRAIIGHDGTTEHLGQFETPELAAHAYDAAAKKYFGEYARLNFPNDS